MKSLTKFEIIELAKKHSLPISTPVVWEFVEKGLMQFVADVLNAATVGEAPAASLRTDGIAGQFAAVPLLTLELQCNRLAMVGDALSCLVANTNRKKRGNDIDPMSKGDEAAYLHAASVVIREASRVMASLARNESGSLQ